MSVRSISSAPDLDRFQHDAVVYHGPDGFLDATVDFIREGVEADEPVLVAVVAPKIERLRAALGPAAKRVQFADMAQLGRNPARIIPAWHAFLDTYSAGGRTVRGVGEPIYLGRRPAEITECHIHEALLNTAFDDGPAWRLRCPYDGDALPGEAAAAAHTHPAVVTTRGHETGGRGPADFGAEVFHGALPDPVAPVETLLFGGPGLVAVRDAVDRQATDAGFSPGAADQLTLAVHEVATNSLKHGGGRGTLRMWRDAESLVFEVRDHGRITEPLIGRTLPPLDGEGGRGVWLANQICDLVQIRSSESGTTVRLHVWL